MKRVGEKVKGFFIAIQHGIRPIQAVNRSNRDNTGFRAKLLRNRERNFTQA